MLSLSIAARQQTRCLNLALARTVANSAKASNTSPFAALCNRRESEYVNKCPALTGTLVPRAPLSVSPTMKSSGDHSTMWKVEKMVTIFEFSFFAVPFIWTNPVTDAIFCTVLVLHSHWGVETMCVDYIRPLVFGGNTLIPKLFQGAVWVLSAFTLGALYWFNYTDVGLVQAIKMLWTL